MSTLKPIRDVRYLEELIDEGYVLQGRRAEKKQKVVECSVLDICFFIRCWTFDVRCSSFSVPTGKRQLSAYGGTPLIVSAQP